MWEDGGYGSEGFAAAGQLLATGGFGLVLWDEMNGIEAMDRALRTMICPNCELALRLDAVYWMGMLYLL